MNVKAQEVLANAGLKTPQGFTATALITGLGSTRHLAVTQQGDKGQRS